MKFDVITNCNLLNNNLLLKLLYRLCCLLLLISLYYLISRKNWLLDESISLAKCLKLFQSYFLGNVSFKTENNFKLLKAAESIEQSWERFFIETNCIEPSGGRYKMPAYSIESHEMRIPVHFTHILYEAREIFVK